MASDDFELGPIPPPGRRRELWLQHAAGFVLFEDVRQYARGQIAPDVNETERTSALKAIDDALYGLMMVIDGVSGRLTDGENRLRLSVAVELASVGPPALSERLDLADGDGMCMGFHGWVDGDFGRDPIVRRDV